MSIWWYCEFGNWCIPNQEHKYLWLQDGILLREHLSPDKLKTIHINDIAYKGFNLPKTQTHENCICCNGIRYIHCDTTYPGILLEGKQYNNYNKKYLCIDGKHRLMKLAEKGTVKSKFYIFTYDEVKHLIKELPAQALKFNQYKPS